MSDALTSSQVLILRRARKNDAPIAGAWPDSYLQDMELLLLMRLMHMRIGVSGITPLGLAYLERIDASGASVDGTAP